MNEHSHQDHHPMSTTTVATTMIEWPAITADHQNLSSGFSNIFTNHHQRLSVGDFSDSNFMHQHHGSNMLEYYHPGCQSISSSSSSMAYSSQHYDALDTSEDFSFSWTTNGLSTKMAEKDEAICSNMQQVDDVAARFRLGETTTVQVKRQRLITKRNETSKKRNLANIQERKRMHRLNDALDQLRKIVPAEYRQKRMSKMQILHSAITYIKRLQDILQSN